MRLYRARLRSISGTWCRAKEVATASHSGSRASKEHSRNRARVPNRFSRMRAWSSISASTSMASTTLTPSCSSIASARAPVPVPRSSTRVGWTAAILRGGLGQSFLIARDEPSDGLVVGIDLEAKMATDGVTHNMKCTTKEIIGQYAMSTGVGLSYSFPESTGSLTPSGRWRDQYPRWGVQGTP